MIAASSRGIGIQASRTQRPGLRVSASADAGESLRLFLTIFPLLTNNNYKIYNYSIMSMIIGECILKDCIYIKLTQWDISDNQDSRQ
jgi:hypothetical protein